LAGFIFSQRLLFVGIYLTRRRPSTDKTSIQTLIQVFGSPFQNPSQGAENSKCAENTIQLFETLFWSPS
jgi:hypothetical protein